MDRVVIVGGGPGGYEAAHVAAQLGAEVTVVDTDGVGGSAVLTDCVPSKTLIATAELMTDMADAAELGVDFSDHRGRRRDRDLGRPGAGQRPGQAARGRPVRRHRGAAWTATAYASSRGRGRLDGPQRVVVDLADGGEETPRGRRDPARHRRRAAHAADRPARRRADPDLGAGLRPHRGADAPDRRRLRCHRRGVRQRLPRARHRRSPWSPARPGAARRGRRRRRRCSRTCSPAAA